MKGLILMICIGILAASFPAFALEENDKAGAVREYAVIGVKGLVCEFCVKNIENIMKKQDEVDDVSIDLATAKAKVIFKEGRTIDDAKLKQLINDAGYEVDTIERSRG